MVSINQAEKAVYFLDEVIYDRRLKPQIALLKEFVCSVKNLVKKGYEENNE